MTTATTEQQMLDVLIISSDPMMGFSEKLTHHDIGLVPGGNRRTIMGTELNETMNRVVANAAEDFLMPDEDLTITWGSLATEIKARSSQIAHFGGEFYAAHLTNESGTDAWAVFYIRLLDTELRVA